MRGCVVSRRYIHVCNCDRFSVVNVYIDHLKFCVVCINRLRYVCCSKCNGVSKECNDHLSCATYRCAPWLGYVLWIFCFRGELSAFCSEL